MTKLVRADQWTSWKFQLKIILKAGGMWEVTNGATPKPAQNATAWIKLDCQAQKFIVTSLGDETMLHVLNEESSADMWSKLESVFEQKTETSIHFLQQQFFSYVKDQDDSISIHISKLQKLAKQLEDMGEKMTDNMLITKILMTLPDGYNHFYSSWEATERSERTLRNLVSRLSMEEARLGFQVSRSAAFQAKGAEKKMGKGFNTSFEERKRKLP